MLHWSYTQFQQRSLSKSKAAKQDEQDEIMSHGCASVKSGVEIVDWRQQEVIECKDLKMSGKEKFLQV